MAENKFSPQDLVRLAPVVEGLFTQATKQFAAPAPLVCRGVAFNLLALRGHQRRGRTKPKIVKTGELFLRQLAEERKIPEYWLALMSQRLPVEAWRRYYQRLLDGIDQTQQHIEALLPDLSLEDSYPDPIRKIAAVATEAWRGANGGKAPRGKNPDDPLCTFVVAALSKIGQRISPAEVSDILRGRRRKPREGRIL